MKIFVCPFVLLVVVSMQTPVASAFSPPSECFASNGFVFVVNDQGEAEQLTHDGKDRGPVLSPQRDTVVFLRKSTNMAFFPSGETPDLEPGEPLPDFWLADQLWLADIRTGQETRLVPDYVPHGATSEDWFQNLISVINARHICFSSDGRKVYFLSEAGVRSSVLHEVDIDTLTRRFVMAANSVDVLHAGQYQDHLIVNNHRYFMGGGSYDWWWLYSPDGTEVGPIGDTEDQVHYFKKVYAGE